MNRATRREVHRMVDLAARWEPCPECSSRLFRSPQAARAAMALADLTRRKRNTAPESETPRPAPDTHRIRRAHGGWHVAGLAPSTRSK